MSSEQKKTAQEVLDELTANYTTKVNSLHEARVKLSLSQDEVIKNLEDMHKAAYDMWEHKQNFIVSAYQQLQQQLKTTKEQLNELQRKSETS